MTTVISYGGIEMSEDKPKQPEPVKPENITSTPQKATPSGDAFQKFTQSLQQNWTRVQPVLKAQSIKTLRGTIQVLEGVVEKLETESGERSRNIAGNVFTPTGELPPVIATLPETPTSNGFRFQTFWQAALEKVRSVLPQSINQKLSDRSLTGAIAFLIILLIGTTSIFLPDESVSIAEKPLPAPELIPIAEKPSPAPEPILIAEKPSPAPEEPAPVAQIPAANIETPSELTAPKLPEPVKIAPPPPPVLTPEQNLIAGIQNQVAEVTSQYADGLIDSIKANFPASLLVVKVSDSWYNLNQSQQDKLAAEMLQRSQELDFSKLQISDSQGKLLARSPVVGGDMIILKRREPMVNS